MCVCNWSCAFGTPNRDGREMFKEQSTTHEIEYGKWKEKIRIKFKDKECREKKNTVFFLNKSYIYYINIYTHTRSTQSIQKLAGPENVSIHIQPPTNQPATQRLQIICNVMESFKMNCHRLNKLIFFKVCVCVLWELSYHEYFATSATHILTHVHHIRR